MQSILQAQHDTLRQIEGHAKHDKGLQVAQLYATYKNLKDSDRVVEELAEINKTLQDGFEAMGEEIKETLVKQAEQSADVVTEVSKQIAAVKPENQVIREWTESTSRNVQKQDGYFKLTQGTGGNDAVQQRGLMKMFDLSEGQSQGWLGKIIRNKVARDQYVRDEKAINPEANEKELRAQFKVRTQTMSSQSDALKEVDRMRAAGRREDEIEKTGIFDTLIKLNALLDASAAREAPQLQFFDPALVDPNRSIVNATGAVDRANREESPLNLLRETNQAFIGKAANDAEMTGVEEEREVENMRLMDIQTQTLLDIKSNTDCLPLWCENMQQNKAEPVATEGSSGGGGGILEAIAGLLGARALVKRFPRAPVPRTPAPAPRPGPTTGAPRPAPPTPKPPVPGTPTPTTATPKPPVPGTPTPTTATPSAGGAASKAPTSKWGRFLKFVERKAPKLFARVGARLAAAGSMALVPGIGWIAAAVTLGLNFWMAYELYELWQEFSDEKPEEGTPVSPEDQKMASQATKVQEYKTQYQEANLKSQEAEAALKTFEEGAGPKVKKGYDLAGGEQMGYEDPEKQAEYDRLIGESGKANREERNIVRQAKQDIDRVDNSPTGTIKVIDALKNRYDYTDEELQKVGGGPTPENFIEVDGVKYSHQVIGLYNNLVERELQQPVAAPSQYDLPVDDRPAVGPMPQEDSPQVTVNGEVIGTMGEDGIVASPGQEESLAAAQAKTREMVEPTSGVTPPANKYERAKAKAQKYKDQAREGSGTRVAGELYQEAAPTPTQQAVTDVAKPAPRSGDVVYSGSSDVAAAQSKPAASPVVVNAPSSSNVVQTSNYAVPSPPRNTDSSVKEYNRSRFAW